MRCAAEITKQQDDIARIGEILQSRVPKNQFRRIFREIQGAQSGVFCTEEYARLKPLVFCISEYPGAGFIDSVPCGEDSAPAEVLLMPEDIVSYTSARWAAPPGARSVALNIALPCESLITSVGVIADPQGYTREDRPVLEVKVMETLEREKVSFTWDTLGGAGSSCGTPECARSWIEGGSMVSYPLEESAYGSIVFVKVSLPEDASPSARIHMGKLIISGKPLLTTKSLRNIAHYAGTVSPQLQEDQAAPLPEREVSDKRQAQQQQQPPLPSPVLFPPPSKKSFVNKNQIYWFKCSSNSNSNSFL